MNKTRYSATEFGGNKPMNFRLSGTLSDQESCISPVDGILDDHMFLLINKSILRGFSNQIKTFIYTR